MSDERRLHGRDRSFARILIEVEGRVGYVSDVSDRGFKGLFLEPFLEPSGTVLTVRVNFEELGLSSFDLVTRLCWSRPAEGAGEVGFELLPSGTGREELAKFMRLRDYYAQANLPST